MDRKKKDRPKPDRARTEQPPVTARTPKGAQEGEGREPGDIERATHRGERDFDPNVNQRPR